MRLSPLAFLERSRGQHCPLAPGTVHRLQSGINTIEPADAPLILVAQGRLVKASRITRKRTLEVLSITPLDLMYHTIVDIKRIAKAPAHMSQVCPSNHTHPTWSCINDVATDIQKCLHLWQRQQR